MIRGKGREEVGEAGEVGAAAGRGAAATANEPATDELLLPFTVRRAAEKIGRNDPCHCGSGKKYKKCCIEKDKARLADPSPYRGLTMEEAKRDPARHGDPGIFFEMTREEAEAADPAALEPGLLLGLVDALAGHGAFARAALVLDELARRGPLPDVELHLEHDQLVYHALCRGDLEFARAQHKKRVGPETTHSRLNQLVVEDLAGEPGPALLSIEALVGDLIDEGAPLLEVADALSLGGLPGISLALTRAAAAIREGKPDSRSDAKADRSAAAGRTDAGAATAPTKIDRAVVEEMLIEQREALGLSGEDPAVWLTELGGRKRPQRRAQSNPDLDQLKDKLLERESAIQKVRSERDRLAGELQKRSVEMAAPASRGGDGALSDEEARRYKRKIEELQGELRQKQQDQQDLRSRLRNAATTESAGGPRRVEPAPVPADEESGEDLPDDAQVHAARFTDLFYETAADVDGKMVLRAQEMAVRFAALDPATWKQAKKMQDLTGIFTLRVGIHHRLFVTRRDGVVEARELIPRESFERTLKRYRR